MRNATAEQQADHAHDLLKHDKPSARVRQVAYLTAYLDTLLTLGIIPDDYRAGIRATVDSTRKMFDLPDLGLRGRS